MKLTRVDSAYSPQPEAINTQRQFVGAFGKCETEVIAGWLVEYCQHRGKGWAPFSQVDFKVYCLDRGHHFYERHTPYHWLEEDDGQHYFTKEFVTHCHEASLKR